MVVPLLLGVLVAELDPVAAVAPEPVSPLEAEPVAATEPEPVAGLEPELVLTPEPEPVLVLPALEDVVLPAVVELPLEGAGAWAEDPSLEPQGEGVACTADPVGLPVGVLSLALPVAVAPPEVEL